MSLIEIVKETAGTVLEAISENPVVAAGAAAGTLAIGGGAFWLRKRSKAKKAAIQQAIVAKKEADTQQAIAEGKLHISEVPPINGVHKAAQEAVVKLDGQTGGAVLGIAK